MKTSKTNAVRILERLGVQFGLRGYEVDPDDLSAETVARKVGLPPEQVFKTLVARGVRLSNSVCRSETSSRRPEPIEFPGRADGFHSPEIVLRILPEKAP